MTVHVKVPISTNVIESNPDCAIDLGAGCICAIRRMYRR